MISCRVRASNVGWWVKFPDDPTAVLLLDTDEEKIAFAAACGVDLDDRDLLLALDLGEIAACSEDYYELAKTFPEDPPW